MYNKIPFHYNEDFAYMNQWVGRCSCCIGDVTPNERTASLPTVRSADGKRVEVQLWHLRRDTRWWLVLGRMSNYVSSKSNSDNLQFQLTACIIEWDVGGWCGGREVLVPNLGRDISATRTEISRGFPQPLWTNFKTVSRLRHDRFPQILSNSLSMNCPN
jgi:hypothetical protein